MKINFIFAWYDFWVGFFWDRKDKKLYIFPVPCFGISISFTKKNTKTSKTKDPCTIILAENQRSARAYSEKNRILNWRYAFREEDLYGYRNIKLIKLYGWDHNKSRHFLDLVKRIEAYV